MFYKKLRKPTLSEVFNFVANVLENAATLLLYTTGLSWLANKFSRFIPNVLRPDSYSVPISITHNILRGRLQRTNDEEIKILKDHIENLKLDNDEEKQRATERLKICQTYAADQKKYSTANSYGMMAAMYMTTRINPANKDDLPKLALAAAVGLELSTYAYEPLLYFFEQSGLKAKIYDPCKKVYNEAYKEVYGKEPDAEETDVNPDVSDPNAPRARPWGTPRSLLFGL